MMVVLIAVVVVTFPKIIAVCLCLPKAGFVRRWQANARKFCEGSSNEDKNFDEQ
jgi:hypothetical protein